MGEQHPPWWASGSDPEEGLDGDDAFEAHRRARAGGDGPAADGPPPPGWLVDAIDAVTRLASAGAQRLRADHPARNEDGPAPHPPGQVCDACPVCLTLRAVREVRPEAVAHLAEAARHVSLALKALADAQAAAVAGDRGFERIDLDGL